MHVRLAKVGSLTLEIRVDFQPLKKASFWKDRGNSGRKRKRKARLKTGRTKKEMVNGKTEGGSTRDHGLNSGGNIQKGGSDFRKHQEKVRKEKKT